MCISHTSKASAKKKVTVPNNFQKPEFELFVANKRKPRVHFLEPTEKAFPLQNRP